MSKHRNDAIERIDAPLPEEEGDAISAEVRVQPNAFNLEVKIGGTQILMLLPHDQVPALDVILAAYPQLVHNALQQLRQDDEVIDDTEDV